MIVKENILFRTSNKLICILCRRCCKLEITNRKICKNPVVNSAKMYSDDLSQVLNINLLK